MNRFGDIAEFCLAELMPETLKAMGYRGKVALFKLRVADLRFRSDIAGGVIVVKTGYETDLASIPSWAWFLFMAADDPRISAGSVIHDKIYGDAGLTVLEGGIPATLTRKQCDQILAFEAMADLGASKLQQWCVYLALRSPFGDRWKDGQ